MCRWTKIYQSARFTRSDGGTPALTARTRSAFDRQGVAAAGDATSKIQDGDRSRRRRRLQKQPIALTATSAYHHPARGPWQSSLSTAAAVTPTYLLRPRDDRFFGGATRDLSFGAVSRDHDSSSDQSVQDLASAGTRALPLPPNGSSAWTRAVRGCQCQQQHRSRLHQQCSGRRRPGWWSG